MSPHALIWIVAAAATAGIIIRPFNWPEAVWPAAGAVLLVLCGLLSPADALTGIASGADVYLFLAGMMLLAEIARYEGLFDWLAALATIWARGSAHRLFLLIYGVGIVVTTFLSNDATAVVLTPAVAAAVRAAKARPLPYLLICAFVANAASFVLPISNPANLVVYGSRMPALMEWLPRYLLPSLLAIVATYVMLYWTQRADLQRPLAPGLPLPQLTAGGKTAALGLAGTAIALLASSTLDIPLGLPTAIAATLTAAFVLIRTRTAPWQVVRDISWGVLPLVAGLFVLVSALDQTGMIDFISTPLRRYGVAAAWAAGGTVAIASNLANNLPVGLVAGAAVQAANAPDAVTRAILIGVNLGPNLSVTGSLATILWLGVLRREGQNVSAARFLKLGIVVMPPALVLALAGALMWP